MIFLRFLGIISGAVFLIAASFFSILFLLLVLKAATAWAKAADYKNPFVISMLVLFTAVLSGALGSGLLLWIFGS